ncbi:MAG: hypothetical protein JSS53_08120 [Proteobacteria bacterium]|nr:hypothetical protein [Pseudomonadota bacterium]
MLLAHLIAKTSPLIADISKRATYSAASSLVDYSLTSIGTYMSAQLPNSRSAALLSWMGKQVGSEIKHAINTILKTSIESWWADESSTGVISTNPYTIAGIAVVCLAAGYYVGWHARNEITAAVRGQADHSENRLSLQM